MTKTSSIANIKLCTLKYKNSGLGTQRKVTTTDGKELIHEIFEYNDTQQTLAFTFKADFLPIKDGRCFISIKSKRAGKATLDFKVTMKQKFGFVGVILGKLFKRNWRIK
jgi:hypothetical protein